MTTRAFQKIYTKIDNITKATVTLRATGVGNDELATVGGKLAQVVKLNGENVTLQVFQGTEGIATNSEVVFHGEHPKLKVSDALAGRFINAFGEELIVDNAEKGLAEACAATGAQVLEYTAAPVYMDAAGKCRHQWLVEFSQEPADLQEFARLLDEALQRINSDYEAKRYKDITLQPLQIVKARPGVFHDWLKSKGKLGGQHKVPRLSNKPDTIEEILKMNED